MSALGCQPSADITELPSTDTEAPSPGSSSTLGAESSGGDIEPTTSGSSGDVEDVCCEMILPPWQLCADTPSTALDAPRVLTELASMPDSTRGPLLDLDGGFYIEAPADRGTALHGWTAESGVFAPAFVPEPGEEIKAATSGADELFVLLRSRDAEDRLISWSPQSGSREIASFGEWEVGGSSNTFSTRLHANAAQAWFELPAHGHFDEPDAFSAAVVRVDLATGEFDILPEPLAGYTATAEGWLALRPSLDRLQFCYDGACSNGQSATSWSLIAGPADVPEVRATGSCVESNDRGAAGQKVTHAWEYLSSYVFVGKDSARQISADGVETELWRGEGEAVDALLHEGALYVSLSLENETGRPGSGRNQILQIPLDDGVPERLVDISTDDVRQVIRFGTVDEGLVYLAVPGPNNSRNLSALAL